MKTTNHNNSTADLLASNHLAAPDSQWDRWAAKAAAMNDAQLAGAIADCVATSLHFERNGMCGGKYRDELSVLRAVQGAR